VRQHINAIVVTAVLSATLWAPCALAQKDRYPDKPVRLMVPFAQGGLDASSEQGPALLRDANVRESAAAAGMMAQASTSREQYPTRPIRLIVPFAPGGGIDTIGRIMAQKLSASFGQSVVVDNRAGAGGKIGIETALDAAPDGYTMLFISGGYCANAAIYKLPYDPIADVTPVAMIGESGYVIALNPTVPAKNTSELIALAKAKPGGLNYGTSGVGGLTHLATELFELMAGIRMAHVPYKGSGPALTDLLGGQIQVSFAAVPVTMPHVKTNRLRAIAVTTARRIGAIPEIPTIAETLPGYETILWYGVLGPKGLRKDVLARWGNEIESTLKNAEMRERITAEGFETGDTSAARLRDVIKRDIAKWSKVVKEANIKVAQ
jgi:tripartite-type tricarboxylate transporter receptor subunit TctC